MRVLMILPSLTEAKSPFFRPIKYSLFPPLGLATLAAYFSPGDEVRIIDEHVEHEIPLEGEVFDEPPDLVVIQVYITNAHRAYALADAFRARGSLVLLGGLHVTSLPAEASQHADAVFLGPGEHTFPLFLADLRSGGRGSVKAVYDSRQHPRTLLAVPPIRRDLIHRSRYLVPNSIVVSRGCPHHCTFCYKDAFFEGGRSFYTQKVDAALEEIDRLPGRHLYFLDDHLLGDVRFARALFEGLKGGGRVFQGAATIDSILRGDLIEHAVAAGLRSIFVGFETLSAAGLAATNKRQNLERDGRRRDYEQAIKRLDGLGVMINGSFVFGIDGDDVDVFSRTVEWAIEHGLTTATFHIATPYPGTAFFRQIEEQKRLLHREWQKYDTRQAVFRPLGMTTDELEAGYWRAYREFYSWSGIARASISHATPVRMMKHFAYAAAWKKLEPIWNVLVRSGMLGAVRPVIETGLDVAMRRGRAKGLEAKSRVEDAEVGVVEVTVRGETVNAGR